MQSQASYVTIDGMSRKRGAYWTKKRHTRGTYANAQRELKRRTYKCRAKFRIKWIHRRKIQRHMEMYYRFLNEWCYEYCNRLPVPFEMIDEDLRISLKRLALKNHNMRKKWTRNTNTGQKE